MKNLDYSYTNYHCLNFFTSSHTLKPALIYPAPSVRYTDNQYVSTMGFTFSFYVNPNRTNKRVGEEFNAGTVMHLSSAYAVSIVSGSSRNDQGYIDGFRIVLQLSHSADVNPSQIDLNVANGSRVWPQDLIFVTEDNSLKFNHWTHFAAGWEPNRDNRTGSFYINGNTKHETGWKFVVDSGSINTSHLTYTGTNKFCPLMIGQYFDGVNSLEDYFNVTQATAGGIETHNSDVAATDPSISLLTCSLNAEVHDVRIHSGYLLPEQILTASQQGPDTVISSSLMFYLPPFFTKNSPKREVLETVFQTQTANTEEPFNSTLSFDVDGRDINLENFVMDQVNLIHPRLYQLTASAIAEQTSSRTANQFLYEYGTQSDFVRARNLFCIPCDNGKFTPNFNLLQSGSRFEKKHGLDVPISGSANDRFVDDGGFLDLNAISLRNLLPTSSIMHAVTDYEWNDRELTVIADSGPRQGMPIQTGVLIDSATKHLVLQRTRDNSSNEVAFFNISNLFYGSYISPGTFSIEDSNVSGSNGIISIKLKDDSFGNLYRADCKTEHAKWSSIGNILYEEGLVLVKTPNIPFFGKDQFETNFEGNSNIYCLEINSIATAGKINSSSNSSFNDQAKPSSYANDSDRNFVAISGLLFHDNNMNIIARTNFAQPIIKKQSDKFLFRVKIDF